MWEDNKYPVNRLYISPNLIYFPHDKYNHEYQWEGWEEGERGGWREEGENEGGGKEGGRAGGGQRYKGTKGGREELGESNEWRCMGGTRYGVSGVRGGRRDEHKHLGDREMDGGRKG